MSESATASSGEVSAQTLGEAMQGIIGQMVEAREKADRPVAYVLTLDDFGWITWIEQVNGEGHWRRTHPSLGGDATEQSSGADAVIALGRLVTPAR